VEAGFSQSRVNDRTSGVCPDAFASIAPDAAPAESHLRGDVTGIDPRHIVRTDPPDGTPNYEPNYLAGIEFDHPDFIWLFTPAAPNGNRLRP